MNKLDNFLIDKIDTVAAWAQRHGGNLLYIRFHAGLLLSATGCVMTWGAVVLSLPYLALLTIILGLFCIPLHWFQYERLKKYKDYAEVYRKAMFLNGVAQMNRDDPFYRYVYLFWLFPSSIWNFFIGGITYQTVMWFLFELLWGLALYLECAWALGPWDRSKQTSEVESKDLAKQQI